MADAQWRTISDVPFKGEWGWSYSELMFGLAR